MWCFFFLSLLSLPCFFLKGKVLSGKKHKNLNHLACYLMCFSYSPAASEARFVAVAQLDIEEI